MARLVGCVAQKYGKQGPAATRLQHLLDRPNEAPIDADHFAVRWQRHGGALLRRDGAALQNHPAVASQVDRRRRLFLVLPHQLDAELQRHALSFQRLYFCAKAVKTPSLRKPSRMLPST